MEKHGIEDGFIVGGIAEKGHSSNDIDIITDAELPAPFHVITDSEKPTKTASKSQDEVRKPNIY